MLERAERERERRSQGAMERERDENVTMRVVLTKGHNGRVRAATVSQLVCAPHHIQFVDIYIYLFFSDIFILLKWQAPS